MSNNESGFFDKYHTKGRYLITERKYDEALSIFIDLVDKWPEHKLFQYYLSICYAALNDYDKSIIHIENAINIDPFRFSFRLSYATTILYGFNDVNKTLIELNKCDSILKNYGNSTLKDIHYYNLLYGKCYELLNDYENAKIKYNDASNCHSKIFNLQGCWYLGRLHQQLSELDNAQAYYDEIYHCSRERFGTFSTLQLPMLHCAGFYIIIGNLSAAIDLLEILTDNKNQNYKIYYVNIYFYFGYIYQKWNELEISIEYYTKCYQWFKKLDTIYELNSDLIIKIFKSIKNNSFKKFHQNCIDNEFIEMNKKINKMTFQNEHLYSNYMCESVFKGFDIKMDKSNDDLKDDLNDDLNEDSNNTNELSEGYNSKDKPLEVSQELNDISEKEFKIWINKLGCKGQQYINKFKEHNINDIRYCFKSQNLKLIDMNNRLDELLFAKLASLFDAECNAFDHFLMGLPDNLYNNYISRFKNIGILTINALFRHSDSPQLILKIIGQTNINDSKRIFNFIHKHYILQ